MTDDMMSLRSLLQNTSDVDLLREAIGYVAKWLMELRSALRPALGMAKSAANA